MMDVLAEEWQRRPPEILVCGEGPYACALAQVLGTRAVAPFDLHDSVPDSTGRCRALVLSGLRRAFLVAARGDSAGDILDLHGRLWDCVIGLSADRDDHRMRLAILLPPSSERLADSLATGLGFPSLKAAEGGCLIAPADLPLADLLEAASAIPMTDFVSVRGRFRADLRRNALRRLAGLVLQSEDGSDAAEAIRDAAMAVMETFGSQEFDLDHFCRPPRHPHGNALRQWLGQAVTGRVTPLDWNSLVIELD